MAVLSDIDGRDGLSDQKLAYFRSPEGQEAHQNEAAPLESHPGCSAKVPYNVILAQAGIHGRLENTSYVSFLV
jgi:hypothetical protein